MSLHLDGTLGAAFVGLIVAATLHGVACVQTLYYFTHQRDRWPTKLLVTVVIFIDTVHQALISHAVYTYVITDWGISADLERLVWSLIVHTMFTGLTTFIVQSFLAMRMWRLSNGNLVLISVVALLVTGEFACVLAYVIKELRLTTFAEVGPLKALSMTVNVLAAAGDILIAAALCTMLHLSRTGFRRSDTLLHKLILFTVSTGVVTSICAVASLISILAAGNTYIYIAFYFCLGRLYTNSLLATLNAREAIKMGGRGMQTVTEDLSLSALPKNNSLSNKDGTGVAIRIDTTQNSVADSGQEFNLNLEKSQSRNSSQIPFDVALNKEAC